MDRKASIEIEQDCHPVSVREGLSPDGVRDVIRGFEGETDVTITLFDPTSPDRLMVAVSGTHAFVGLDQRGTLFQYLGNNNDNGRMHEFVIGGQATQIPARYVVTVEQAAHVAGDWLATEVQSRSSAWERQ